MLGPSQALLIGNHLIGTCDGGEWILGKKIRSKRSIGILKTDQEPMKTILHVLLFKKYKNMTL